MLFGVGILTLGLIGYLLSLKFAEQNNKITTMFELLNNVIQDVQMIKIQHTVDKISNDVTHSLSGGEKALSIQHCTPLSTFKQIVVSDDEGTVVEGTGIEGTIVELDDDKSPFTKSGKYHQLPSGTDTDSDEESESDEDSDSEPDTDSDSQTDSDNEDDFKELKESVSDPLDIYPERVQTPPTSVIEPSEIRTIFYPTEDTSLVFRSEITELEPSSEYPSSNVKSEHDTSVTIIDELHCEPTDTITINIGSIEQPDYSKLDVTQLRKLVSEKKPTVNLSKLKKKELISLLSS